MLGLKLIHVSKRATDTYINHVLGKLNVINHMLRSSDSSNESFHICIHSIFCIQLFTLIADNLFGIISLQSDLKWAIKAWACLRMGGKHLYLGGPMARVASIDNVDGMYGWN